MSQVTVKLLKATKRIEWKDIRNGQIFMGRGMCAPKHYPPNEATGGYGHPGPWLKVMDGLYDFASGGYWGPNMSSNHVWFEDYYPLDHVQFVELET